MDFAKTYHWQLAAVPVGTQLKAVDLSIGGPAALEWTAKYAYMGIGIHFPDDLFATKMTDAMNTEGLSAAALWLPPSRYPERKNAPQNAKLVSALDICSWAVSNYATVAELTEDLYAIKQGKATSLGDILHFWDPLQFHGDIIYKLYGAYIKNLLPVHFQFHDKHGQSLVLEFRDGDLSITRNTDIGVMTNAPFIDWHRTNLENYLGVTNVETNKSKIIGLEVSRAGNGGGTIGLSYSPLPSDRFIRTAMALNFSMPWLMSDGITNDDAVSHAMNVIRAITVIREQCIDEIESTKGDYTQWDIVRDHVNNVFYIKTVGSFGPWTVNFSDYALAEGDKPYFFVIPDATEMPALKPNGMPTDRPVSFGEALPLIR